MKNDVFISYSRRDKDKVLPLAEELIANDLKIWIDTSKIDYGETFPDKIAEALDNSDSILFFYTQNSANSEFCMAELTYARKNKKQIRFVLVDGVMPTTGAIALTFQNINCVNLKERDQEQKLIEELLITYNPSRIEERNKRILEAQEQARQRIREQEELLIKEAAERVATNVLKSNTHRSSHRIKITFAKPSTIVVVLIASIIAICSLCFVLSSPICMGKISSNGLAYSLGFKKCVSHADGILVFETHGGKYTIRSKDNPKEVLCDTIFFDFIPSVDSIMWLRKSNTWICIYKGEFRSLAKYFDFKKIDKVDEFLFNKDLLSEDFTFNQDSLNAYKGKIVAKSEYDKTSKPSEYDGFIVVNDIKIAKTEDYERNTEMGFKYGIVDSHYNILYPPVLDKISNLTTTNFIGKYKNKYGLVFIIGKKSKQKWSSYFSFDEEFTFLKNSSTSNAKSAGKWGLLSNNADTLLAFDYDSIGQFHENLIRVKKDGKWGFLDNNYLWKIQNSYLSVEDFNNGYTIVQEVSDSGYYKYIDKNGQELPYITSDSVHANQHWQEAEPFVRLQDSRLVGKVKKDDLYGLVIVKSDSLFPYVECKYEDVEACLHAKGVAFYKDDGRYGVLRDNKTIISPTYTQCPFLYDGYYYKVYDGDYCGIIHISKAGEIRTTIPISFNYINSPNGTYCIVEKDGKNGLYSFCSTGSTKVLDCKYDNIYFETTDRNGQPLFIVRNETDDEGVFDGKRWRLAFKQYYYVFVYDSHIEYVNINDDYDNYHYIYW